MKPSRRCHETIDGESVLTCNSWPCNSFTKSFGLHSEQEVKPLEASVQQKDEVTKIILLESLGLKDTGQLFSLLRQ